MRTSSSCKLVQPADAIDGIILYGLGLQAGVVQGLQLATEQLRRANYHLKPVYIIVFHHFTTLKKVELLEGGFPCWALAHYILDNSGLEVFACS